MYERKLLLLTLITTQDERGTQKTFCDIDVLVFHAAVGTGVFQAVSVPRGNIGAVSCPWWRSFDIRMVALQCTELFMTPKIYG